MASRMNSAVNRDMLCSTQWVILINMQDAIRSNTQEAPRADMDHLQWYGDM